MAIGNPLRWNFTYRAIFALIVFAGALIGTAAGYVAETMGTTNPTSFLAWIGDTPAVAALWALVGATPLGAIAYVIRITAEDG